MATICFWLVAGGEHEVVGEGAWPCAGRGPPRPSAFLSRAARAAALGGGVGQPSPVEPPLGDVVGDRVRHQVAHAPALRDAPAHVGGGDRQARPVARVHAVRAATPGGAASALRPAGPPPPPCTARRAARGSRQVAHLGQGVAAHDQDDLVLRPLAAQRAPRCRRCSSAPRAQLDVRGHERAGGRRWPAPPWRSGRAPDESGSARWGGAPGGHEDAPRRAPAPRARSPPPAGGRGGSGSKVPPSSAEPHAARSAAPAPAARRSRRRRPAARASARARPCAASPRRRAPPRRPSARASAAQRGQRIAARATRVALGGRHELRPLEERRVPLPHLLAHRARGRPPDRGR